MGAETTKIEGGNNAIDIESRPYASIPESVRLTAKEFIANTKLKAGTERLAPHIQERLLILAGNIEMEYSELENLRDALTIADQELPPEIVAKGKDLNTTYGEERDSKADTDLVNEKISSEMQEAIYVVFSALENAKYPVTISNSLAYVLNVGKATNKIPKDIDAYAAVQDFPKAYEALKAKATAEEIVDLRVTPTKNLEGDVNHGFEVSGWIKTGKVGKTLKQFSIFFQNIDPSKNPNGRVLDLGVEERHLNKFKITGKGGDQKWATFTNLDANVVENLRSILWEFRLTDFKEYKDSKRNALGVTAKFLDRFSNLMSLLKIPEENGFDSIILLLEEEVNKNPNKQFLQVVDMIKVLKQDFDSQPTKGEGLLVSICNSHKQKEGKDCSNEKAFEIITKKINERMAEVHEYSMKAEEIFKSNMSDIDKLEGIHVELSKVEKVYDKYTNDLTMLNTENARDFGAYMALKALRDQFIWQSLEEMLSYDETINKRINN